jgi:hypothetical protein
MSEIKPLNWIPQQGIGYTVIRRPDGGMHFPFIDASPATLDHWRAFSLAHLYDSDRLTNNLYDLRALTELPERAVQYAVEVNSDPAVRNIRLAAVTTSPKVIEALHVLAAQAPGGVEMGLFTTLTEAEAWLSRPLTLRV